MKPAVIFNTVIDGVKYTFSVYQAVGDLWNASAYSHNYVKSATSTKSEEDAILKLVKLLEK